MRGIQTIRQLLPIKKGIIATKIPCVEIHDFPRFKWRAMLLDCCRHFMKKEFVMRYIDLLAYHKMNILHWHQIKTFRIHLTAIITENFL